MNQDYSESSVYLFIMILAAFLMLQQFFLETFVSFWRWGASALLFPFLYIPDFISNTLFFWMDNLHDIAAKHIPNLLFKSPEKILALPSVKVGGNYVKDVNEIINAIFVPYMVPFFGVYLYKNINKKEYKGIFSIDTLIRDQADLWPQIKPMVEVRPQRIKNLDEGEWAMGAEPLYFAKKNNLIEESTDKMGETKISLKEDAVRDIFKAQLGRAWKNIEDLDQNEQFLLAIFISKANRNDKLSQEIRAKVATAYSTEKKYSKKQLKTFMAEAVKLSDSILQKYKKSEVFQNTITQHYYVNTLLARMLEMARVDGVLANADFVWLKIRNRSLWYILNNIGRNASWIECAGTWHHFNYEKAIERKIPAPNITGAIASLDLEFRMSADNYIPLSGYNKDFK